MTRKSELTLGNLGRDLLARCSADDARPRSPRKPPAGFGLAMNEVATSDRPTLVAFSAEPIAHWPQSQVSADDVIHLTIAEINTSRANKPQLRDGEIGARSGVVSKGARSLTLLLTGGALAYQPHNIYIYAGHSKQCPAAGADRAAFGEQLRYTGLTRPRRRPRLTARDAGRASERRAPRACLRLKSRQT